MFVWSRFFEIFPKIIVKFPVTLQIVLVTYIMALVLGSVLAMVRIKKIPVLNQIVSVLISYVRCTPVISQLFVVYFGVPMVVTALGYSSKVVDNLVYVYIAFSINTGCFLAEIIRSALTAVPYGQTEAGRSIGLTNFQTFYSIVIPQAFHIALPMLGTSFILLFKATALAYMVGVMDMIGKVKSLGAVSGHTLEGYLACALVFAVISLTMEQIFNLINKRMDFSRMHRAITRKAVKAK